VLRSRSLWKGKLETRESDTGETFSTLYSVLGIYVLGLALSRPQVGAKRLSACDLELGVPRACDACGVGIDGGRNPAVGKVAPAVGGRVADHDGHLGLPGAPEPAAQAVPPRSIAVF
jgi:hypothetical protein